ncbi:uncharacterized protein [Myotis yumanensis]|uniref:uncharacterized protein isoform X1 n=1 Tax=Myotis yumanensis TaxID=159337 RepID=UPI0038D16C6E
MERCWPLDSATELENPRLVTLSPNMSDSRMEDFTKTRPLDIGPIYFFDQMKPKKKKWDKRDLLPHLEHTPEEKHSWHDLIEEANKYETKMSMWKKQDALQSSSSTIIVDKISNYPRTERHEENLLMKTKRDWHHFVSINPMKKIHVVGQKQYSQIFQESHLPFVIHFSLSSKICLENGWIFHYPHTKLEILKWKTVLDIAVKKLQEAIIRIKTEAAKLKKEGFNKQLILRHYNDPKPEAEVDNSPLGSQYFWLELLKGKPQMPAVQQDDPAMKKFHYALIDGSSMI